MKKHLSDMAVQKIKPPKDGILEVFDSCYPGLAIRVGHGGAKTFNLFYRDGGKLHRKKLGRYPAFTLAAAREAWRTTRESVAKGEAPPIAKRNADLLFERLAEEWIRRDQSKHKHLYQVTRALEADLLPAWRGRQVDQIAKRDVIELLDSIADRGAPSMARKVQAYVNRFFAWCVERDHIKSDPTAGMSRVGENVKRERVLSDQELAKVWCGAGELGAYGQAIRLLVLTGARREEVASLRWSEIDGDTIRLQGTRTKNGEAHDIPLSKAARELLAAMPRFTDSDFIFTVNGNRPLNAWSEPKTKIDKLSGVSNWRIHDLRRTTATGMQKLGTPLPVTESVLGHTSGSRSGIVGVYQRHNYAEEKRAALEAWGAHVSSLVR